MLCRTREEVEVSTDLRKLSKRKEKSWSLGPIRPNLDLKHPTTANVKSLDRLASMHEEPTHRYLSSPMRTRLVIPWECPRLML